MIRGVIFDMDGTLTVPYLDFQVLRQALGIPTGDIIEHMKSVSSAERRRLEEILHRFEEDAAANAELQEGCGPLLELLQTRGIKRGLLTRNRRRSVETVLARFGLVLDGVMTREDGAPKPSPEPVLEQVRQWNCLPSEILLVGDYIYDVRCARNAGVKSVLLVNGSLPEWAGEADYVIHRLNELPGVIDRLI